MSVCYLYSQRKIFNFKKHSILSLSSHCNPLCQHSPRRVCSAETVMPSVKYGFWIKKRVQGHIWRRPSYSQLNCFLSCAIYYVYIVVVDVESLSHVRLFVTPWTAPYHLCSPSPSPAVCSDSCPLSPWCHPTVSSSIIPFSSCPQSFPASESFSQWVGSSHQVARELELQHQAFHWICRVDFL